MLRCTIFRDPHAMVLSLTASTSSYNSRPQKFFFENFAEINAPFWCIHTTVALTIARKSLIVRRSCMTRRS